MTPLRRPTVTDGSAAGLAVLLLAAGMTHVVAPRAYEGLIPSRLGSARAWVLGSGAAELACGLAVAAPRTRRSGALAAAGLFVAIFPGNVVMALDSISTRPRSGPGGAGGRGGAGGVSPAIAWGRLPLQVPLVLWALRVARATSDAT